MPDIDSERIPIVDAVLDDIETILIVGRRHFRQHPALRPYLSIAWMLDWGRGM